MTKQPFLPSSGLPKRSLPILRLTNKDLNLPVLQLTAFPNRPVKDATNIKVASTAPKGKKNS